MDERVGDANQVMAFLDFIVGHEILMDRESAQWIVQIGKGEKPLKA